MTYWLSEADAGNFDIDPRTGQLKVEEELDFEDDGNTDKQYSVTVNVADSSGTTSMPNNPMGTDIVMVTITVINVDEKPEFSAGESTIEIEENKTDLGGPGVDTYTAADQEQGVVTFTLSGDDGDKFKLADIVPVTAGSMVLAFKDEPDFENPGDMNEDNVYQVTVVASDGPNIAMQDVTVKVTNITEPGTLEVMPAQPRVGTQLTAELTDSDGIVSGPTWQWYKQVAAGMPTATRDGQGDLTGAWAEINDATSDSYTPVSDDNDAWLLATVVYVDGFYDTDDMFNRTEDYVLPGMVQGSAVNMAPEFSEGTTAMRYVPENAADDLEVGEPVVAKDDPMPTYQIGGADAGSFEINLVTGQITVKADAELDHESKPTHTVTVTATDSRNASATITVTIHVTDLDEAPEAMEYVHSIPFDENRTDPVITLIATDPEGSSPIVWSLMDDVMGIQDIPGEEGPDNVGPDDIVDLSMFKISPDGVLTFASKPNFEARANNDYKVVVQASDGATMAPLSWFKVTVEVMDLEEEGSVKLSPRDNGTTLSARTLLQPQVGVSIGAHSLTDPDGQSTSNRVSDDISETLPTTWQWYRTRSRTATGTAIVGAINQTYTPAGGGANSDIGRYLRVMATYTDGRDGTKTATAVSHYVTIDGIFDNTDPEFPAERAARAVPEETPKGMAHRRPNHGHRRGIATRY